MVCRNVDDPSNFIFFEENPLQSNEYSAYPEIVHCSRESKKSDTYCFAFSLKRYSEYSYLPCWIYG